MTEAGWTAEPKEEGWHWWRKPSDGLTIPYVVKVQKASSGWFVLWQHDWNYAEVLGGEFLGPLSPTDRQQGRLEGIKQGIEKLREREKFYTEQEAISEGQMRLTRGLQRNESSCCIHELEKLAQAAQDEKGGGDAA